MYETEVIEYRVDEHPTQTSVERDNHRIPASELPSPPRVSHVEIDFDLFDKEFLRASQPREKSDTFAREIIAHQFYKYQLGVYQSVVQRISWDSPMRRTHGMEPRGVMMDMFNLVYRLATQELQTSPNCPSLVTPLHWKYQWNDPEPYEAVPALTPCIATILENGVRDLDHWRNTVVFVDFRPEVGYSAEAHAAELDAIAARAKPTSETENKGKAAEGSTSKTQGKGKRKRSDSTSSVAKRSKRGTTPVSPKKTKTTVAEASTLPAVAESDPTNIDATVPPPSGPVVVQDDLWMSRYASEAINELGNRRHMIGILVEGYEIRFFYFDRAGSIRTSKLHLLHDPEKIMAAIVNISLLTVEQLGLQAMKSPDPAAVNKGTFRNIRGCEVSVDGMRYSIVDILHQDRNLYGRGTIVWSALTRRNASEKDKAVVLYDEHLTDEARATDDRNRAEKEDKLAKIPEGVVLKLSWQLVSKPSDDDLYDIAHKRGVNNIATLYGSRVAGRLSDGPRDSLVSREFYQDRVLRVQVFGPVYEPIWKLSSVDQYKRAFIGCVNGTFVNLISLFFDGIADAQIAHHDLYVTGKIIHRDVSPKNLMYSSPGHGTIIDLDHALSVDGLSLREDNTVEPIPPPVAGTPAFMALDLHMEGHALPLKHYYRFDLESFFYSMAWIATHYNQGKASWTDTLGDWMSGNDQKVAVSKRDYIIACIDKSFTYQFPTDVTSTWLPSLAKLFHEAYAARDAARAAGKEFDDETLGGRITYETFIDALELEDEAR